jgi:solute carrier family 25 (peroxisomal adenine nucleotide transporter), member 17
MIQFTSMAHATAATSPAVAAVATAGSVSPQLMIPPIFHAISGALGGSLALLLFYPLERARIEMQRNLSKEHDFISGDRHDLIDGNACPSYLENDSVGRGGGFTKKAAAGALGDSWSMESSEIGSDSTDDFQDAKSHIDEIYTTLTLSECVRRLWKGNTLYRGVAPIVTTLAVSNFVFFYVNELMKRMMCQRTRNSSTNRLLASCLAGICNVLLTNPLWVANLRIVTGKSQSSQLFSEVLHVARVNGISNLWSGTGASLLLVSNPIVQFFLYDTLKSRQALRNSGRITPMQSFVTGAVAKAIATVVTYPLQVAQTVLRMQERPKATEQCEADTSGHQRYGGLWDCMVKVYGRDGVTGLFTGMRAKLLQTVLTAAFTFLTYEQIVTALVGAHQALTRRPKEPQRSAVL